MSINPIFPDFAEASREYWEQVTYEIIKTRTYLDPRYDVAFKVFLNDPKALVSFLNGVFHLKGENRIVSVTVKNTEVNILFPQSKSFRLDIRATTSNGYSINVEMQKAKHSRFIERILLQHSAFMLQSKYEWDQEFFKESARDLSDEQRALREVSRYEIPPTYAIWVCDFHLEQQDDYCGTWGICNEKGLTLTDKVKYILYDLTQFNKTMEQVETDEDRWLWLLKHAGESDSLPDFNDDVIAQAIKRLLVKTAPDSILKQQARNMVMTEEELDYLATLKVRARAEGRAEGREEGRTEGEMNKAREMAKAMLDLGDPIEKVMQISKLTEDEIRKL